MDRLAAADLDDSARKRDTSLGCTLNGCTLNTGPATTQLLISKMDDAWLDAIARGDVASVRAQLALGADVDARDRHGQTALMRAAHAGQRDIVETLIAHQANLDVTAKFGLSALMLALVAGHEQIARLLAQAGADLSLQATGAPSFSGKTAHDLALERGMLQLAAQLRS